MRIDLELSKERPLPGVSLLYLKSLVRETCKKAFPKVFGPNTRVKLEVASVTDETIRVLNKQYRKNDKVTDILSFGTLTSPRETKNLKVTQIDLGQIVVAPDFIARYAKEDGVAWKHEFTFVFVHGILHLLGYDHSTEMFGHQDLITEKMIQLKKRK